MKERHNDYIISFYDELLVRRIASQLCEVFDCTDRELKTSGALEVFNRWLADNPDIVVSDDLETGGEVNQGVAQRFYASYKDG